MTVEGIFGDMDDLDVLILLLKEKNGKRFLPIGIDEAAAGYILMLMHDVKNEQPFIYDLLLRAYDECGSGIKFVVINRIKNKFNSFRHFFYCSVSINYSHLSKVSLIFFRES